MTDALTVDRLQFATTITFHYLFAQLTRGLVLLIVLFGAIGYRRRDENYRRALSLPPFSWRSRGVISRHLGPPVCSSSEP